MRCLPISAKNSVFKVVVEVFNLFVIYIDSTHTYKQTNSSTDYSTTLVKLEQYKCRG